jgi:NADH-quinone oxidoreductase subunit C
MTARLDNLQAALQAALGDKILTLKRERGEITITVAAADWLAVAAQLRDDATLKFEQLMDICGIDYSSWKDQPWDGPRYCTVSHLLSVSMNWRVRVKVFAPDDDLPVVPSVNDTGRPRTGSSARPSTCWA